MNVISKKYPLPSHSMYILSKASNISRHKIWGHLRQGSISKKNNKIRDVPLKKMYFDAFVPHIFHNIFHTHCPYYSRNLRDLCC